MRPPTCTGSLGRDGIGGGGGGTGSPPETKSPTGTPVGDAPKSSAPGSGGSTIGSGWIPSGGDSGTGIAVDGATSARCCRTTGGAGISGLTMMNSLVRRGSGSSSVARAGTMIIVPTATACATIEKTRVYFRIGLLQRRGPSPARAFTPFDTGGTRQFPAYCLPTSSIRRRRFSGSRVRHRMQD